MQKKNTAAVIEKFNSKLRFYDYKIGNLKKGQVLVKILYSGICRSQIMEIEGKRNTKKWLPHMLGHEAVGKVLDYHKNNKKFKKGDEVIATWINSRGIKSLGGIIKIKNKKINYGPITTFSKYALISENKLVKKPKYLKNLYAPFFGCAALTGMGMVYNQAKPKKNQLILLIGLGGIGFFSVLALLEKGIKNIIVVDNNENKKKLARKLGVKHFFNIKKSNEKKKLKDYYSKKIDLCLENSGNSKSIEFCFSMIKDNGKVIFSSHPPEKNKIKIDPHELIKGKKIFGTWGGNCKPDKDIARFSKVFIKNRRFVKQTKSNIYKFDRINDAINDFKKGKILRPIIKF
tara:strand:- start:2660 stop:3694 length:1035 start_codon:yes stop_codon:yes gene_type:complete